MAKILSEQLLWWLVLCVQYCTHGCVCTEAAAGTEQWNLESGSG